MSDRFAAAMSGPVSPIAATTNVCYIKSLVTGRLHLYDWLFGHGGPADDNVISNRLLRFTADPAGTTGVAPSPLDLAAGSAGATCFQNSTGGTLAAVLITIPTNQRASHRWVAAPDGELVIPNTATSGVVYHASHATLSTDMSTTFHWVA